MERYTITIISPDGTRAVPASGGESLLGLLRAEGEQIHAPCGGNGTCRACRVRAGGLLRVGGEVRRHFEEEVLACRAFPAGDVTVFVDRAQDERVRADAEDIEPCGEGLGLAVDIGTTTVAAFLYDLGTGKCLGRLGRMNAQRPYGADVISRIRFSSDGDGLRTLARVIRTQLADMARELCPELDRISYISIAGNTVMEHIFAGLSPEGIGAAPFTPLSLFGTEHSAGEFLEGFSSGCRLYLCPAVAGYVGGDITAGLLASGACDGEGTVLFIDIGTNGEMALGGKDGFLCCATAAGPAFEGAGVDCGSSACSGAIDRVELDLSFTAIGGGEPESICGSGIVDAAAALLYNEIIDESGLLEVEKYFFGEKVFVSRGDVRALQLAKAAIRGGIETLLERSGKSARDVSEVLIAGGFGAYMRVRSACALGLLRPDMLEKTRHIGNSAGRGAALALTRRGRARLDGIAKMCAYEELSSSAVFNGSYIEAMMFDEWRDVL